MIEGVEVDNLLDELCRKAMLDASARTELTCRLFLARTGLPIAECQLVYYKGKVYPQWKGATPLPLSRDRIPAPRLVHF